MEKAVPVAVAGGCLGLTYALDTGTPPRFAGLQATGVE
jgi:hypothetical protein